MTNTITKLLGVPLEIFRSPLTKLTLMARILFISVINAWDNSEAVENFSQIFTSSEHQKVLSDDIFTKY